MTTDRPLCFQGRVATDAAALPLITVNPLLPRLRSTARMAVSPKRSLHATRPRRLLVLLLTAAAVNACGDPLGAILTGDCKSEMDATRAEFGEPQRITDASLQGGWRFEAWSYFDRGFVRGFEWGEPYRACKVSDTPIRAE